MPKTLITLICLVALNAAAALGEGLKDYASPGSKPEFSRVFRPAQDIKLIDQRSSPFATKQQINPLRKYPVQQVPRRPAANPTHGWRHTEKYRQTLGKNAFQSHNSVQTFKPSPSDPNAPSEARNKYVPSQKYIQKYANQLFEAQKNSEKLSEYQRYILSQDPTVMRFVFQQSAATRAAKSTDAGATDRAPSTTTEAAVRYQSTIRQQVSEKPEYATEKVATDGDDNAAEATAYKYGFGHAFKQPYVVQHQDEASLAAYGHYGGEHAIGGDDAAGKAVAYLKAHSAQFGQAHEDPGHEHYQPSTETDYEFKYQVRDDGKSTNFGHAETRKGKATWGKYYVQLSDGRFETVRYWADKTGYHAEVDFKGHAKHPPTVQRGHPEDPSAHHLFTDQAVYH